MRPNYSPQSYAPRSPVGMSGLWDDIKSVVYDPIAEAVSDIGLKDALPTKTDVTSAVKTAATARLQQSITDRLNPTKPAAQVVPTTPTGAPIQTLGPVAGSAPEAPWYERVGSWAQEHPVQATVATVAIAWGIREIWKRR